MRKYKVITTILIVIFLSGCWDKKEVEERAYVMGIGMDLPEDGENAIELTFLIANPGAGASPTEGGQGKTKEIITFTANDIVSGRNTANAVVARELTFEHLQVLIVSEEMAKTSLFTRHMYTATKEKEIRRDVNMIVVPEKASEFIRRNDPQLEARPHRYYRFMTDRTVETGVVPASDINRYFQITEGDADLFLAMFASSKKKDESYRNEDEYLAGQINAKGGNVTQFMGSAVFKEGKMIGTLTGEETRLSLILDPTSKITDMLTTYTDPLKDGYRIATRVMKKESNKMVLNLDKQLPEIKVTVPISLELIAIPSLIDYASNLENRKILKQSIEENLNKKVKQLIIKTQEEFKGESFYWSLKVRQQFPTIKKYEAFDFMKTYPDIDIEVTFDVTISSFGKQIKMSNIKEVQD